VVSTIRLRDNPRNRAAPLSYGVLDFPLSTLWKKEVYDDGEEWIGRGS
jgi:hypothetical protein